MKLKDEIKQRSFSSVHEKVLINLIYTSNWLRDQHNKIFKKFKILQQHYNVLRIVKGQDPKPVSPGYIIEVMLDKKRDLTRLVDKMVKLGYLKRKTCEDNRRKIDISITDKGKEVEKKIRKEILRWMKKSKSFTDKEAELLSDLLDKLRG